MNEGLRRRLGAALPSCCQVGFAAACNYPEPGPELIAAQMPEARTAIVLAHQVRSSLEWAWFRFEASRGNQTCGADLHLAMVARDVAETLGNEGAAAHVLPYPGACGISFKSLAAATALGSIGDNHLFLHHAWGPWVHLRVVLTDAVVTPDEPGTAGPCNHCGSCAEACPVGAIGPDGLDLIACDEAIETGLVRDGIPGSFRPKCELCARVCPAAPAPPALQITLR